MYPQLCYRKINPNACSQWDSCKGSQAVALTNVIMKRKLRKEWISQKRELRQYYQPNEDQLAVRLSSGLPCPTGGQCKYFLSHHACQDIEIKARTQLQLLTPALGYSRDTWEGTLSQLSHFHLVSSLARTECPQLSST